MDLKLEVTEHLTHKLIPFWESLLDEQNGGYFGYMDFDLHLDPQAPKGCILNSRILWFFSRAYAMLGDKQLLACAQHAYAFVDRFWDHSLGGVYWSCTFDGQPLDTMKHTYAQSFAIYALSAYAVATGDQEALSRAMALFELIETRMKDDIGYLEAFDRTFQPLDNQKLSDNPKLMARGLVAEKTMNTMLHVMEAYTSLYEASRDERVKASLRKLLLTISEKVYNHRENRLEVFFDPALHSIFNMQSYGHDIEASWLIDLAARAVFDPEERSVTALWTSRLANGVLTRAFRNGSLMNECAEGEDDPTRIWWVQAESMVGIVNLWQKTGEPCLVNLFNQQWRYIQNTMVDPRDGSEWYWCVDANGAPEHRPIVEPWKCPYHNGRMCMEMIARL